MLQEGGGFQKDTCFFCVGDSSSRSTQHVAVEWDFQSVAVGCIIQQPTKKTPACPGFHSISVEWRTGLQEEEHRDMKRVHEWNKGMDGKESVKIENS